MLVGGFSIKKSRLRYSRARHESAADRLLNVKVKKFNQARVNGGSNYDSQPLREAIVGGRCIVPASLGLLVDLVDLFLELWETSGNTTWNGEALDAFGASLQREAHGVWG